jgi:hypothetical protein
MRRKTYNKIATSMEEFEIAQPGQYDSLILRGYVSQGLAKEIKGNNLDGLEAINYNSIKKFVLNGCTIKRMVSANPDELITPCETQAIRSIVKFINDNKLTEIEFIDTKLEDYIIKGISEALGKCSTLTYLAFNNCSINDASAAYLAKVLETNTSIQELNLSNNRITGSGGAILAQSLKVNKTLAHLRLGGNVIDDEGARAFADLAESGSKLKYLMLDDNLIGDSGAEYLAAALAGNNNISILGLGRNYISEKGITALKATKVNSNMLHQHQVPVIKGEAKEAGISELAELKAKLDSMEKKWGEAEQKAAKIEVELLKVKEENTALAQKLKNYEQQAVSAPVEIVPADDNADDIGSILERLKKSVSLDQGTEQPGAEGTQSLGDSSEHVD